MILFKSKKRGEAISYLLLFIASLMAAMIVMAIFMHNLFGLKNKSMTLADHTKDNGDVFAEIIQIYAQDGTQDGLEYLFIKTKLNNLAKPVRLEELGIMVAFNNNTANYYANSNSGIEDNYNCTWNQNWSKSGYYINDTGDGSFGVEYSMKGPDYKPGYLQKGDVVKICLHLPQKAFSDDELMLSMVPKKSTPIHREIHIPIVYSSFNTYIYPSKNAG